MKLFYCDTCGLRIPANEIPDDQPEPANGKYFCAKHRPAPKLAKPPSATGIPLPASGQHSRTRIIPVSGNTPAHGTRSSIPRMTPAAVASESKRQAGAPPATKPGNKNALIFGAAGGVFIVLAAIIALSGGDKPKAAPRETAVAAGTSTRPADVSKPAQSTNAKPALTPADPVAPRIPKPSVTPATPAVTTPKEKAPDTERPVNTNETPRPDPAAPPVPDVAVANPVDPKPSTVSPTPITPVPPADPKNLVKDGTFESGSLAAWSPSGPVEIVANPAKAHTGGFCARFTSFKGGTLRQILTGMKPGKKYTASAWLNGSGGGFGVKEYGGPELEQFNKQPGYRLLSITFTMGEKAKSVKVFVRQESTVETFADDISLVPVDEPSAVATAPAPENSAGPKALDENPTLKFEQLQENTFALLAENKPDAALTTLSDAKNDPLFNSIGAELDATLASVKGYQSLINAIPEGLKKLNDGRAFTFKKKTGRDIMVGGATKTSVVDFKDGDIVVETKDGGMVATQKIIFDELTDPCRLQLAAQALPAGPETEAKLAFAEFVLLSAGRGGTPAEIKAHVERTKKDSVAAAMGEFVVRTMDVYLRNQRIDAATKKTEAALKEGNNVQARAAYNSIIKEFGPDLPPRAKKFAADHREFEYVAGLWTSYFSGPPGKEFETYHISRVETKLFIDWGTGSPDPSVPVDNFTGYFCGILRIEKAGDYSFESHTDDDIQVKIDDKKVLASNNCAPVEGRVTLTAGDHPIRVYYREHGGFANIHVRWKLESAFDYQDIPLSVLWYDPLLKEQYQKPEK